MFRKVLLPLILGFLAYGFWVSPDFKHISAGVAIFLFGMLFMEEGFKTFTGGLLERFLQKSTNRLWKSLSFGILSTTIMQSSSLVSVITISFLSAGLIQLIGGIGIIFGANIGTTTGAWLVAGLGLKVKISAYAMPMLVFAIVLVLQKNKYLKGAGYVLAGLGFLFLGIHYMKEGFDAFKDQFDLAAYAITGYPGVFLFVGVGALATVVMQSSHATLVLIITGLAAQQVTYENALALAIGANIGTTITAILGALSANAAGRRLAVAHLIFNVVTALVAVGFIFQLVILVDSVSAWMGIRDDDYTLKLAVFHTIFNTLGVLLMIPWINFLVRFLEKIIKEKTIDKHTSQPKYLNDAVLDYPDAAFEVLRKETKHLFDNAFEIIAHGMSLHRKDILSNQPLGEIIDTSRHHMEVDIDDLYMRRIKGVYSAIIEFSTRAQNGMEREQMEILYTLKLANRDLVDAVKDMKDLQKNMQTYIHSRNSHIRHEYNFIRIQIGTILREIYRIADNEEQDDSMTLLSLNKLKIELERSDIVANGVLDRLIRNNLIANQMATSLMNDSAYAYNIGKNLIRVAEIIFTSSTLRKTERHIALDEDDISELATVEDKG
jgi:phosphate:Na+ symporter